MLGFRSAARRARPAPPRRDAAFAEAYAAAEPVEGWLSEDQAQRLWERAAGLPAGALMVEIGSYRGRSAIVLAAGAPEGTRVVAIDPHAGNDRGPQQIEGTRRRGRGDNRAFRANLERAGVAARVEPRPPAVAGRARRGGRLDRPALRRRRAPLRPGARRHRALGRARAARRRAADPRLVLVDRRDAGDPAPAPFGARVPLRRPLRSLAEYRRDDGRGARGARTRRASSRSCPGSRATCCSSWRWSCACVRWPACSDTAPDTGPIEPGRTAAG